MAAHSVDGRKLTGTKFAVILQTPYDTFEYWLREKDKQPPGCLLTLMDILEQSEDARKLVGIEKIAPQ